MSQNTLLCQANGLDGPRGEDPREIITADVQQLIDAIKTFAPQVWRTEIRILTAPPDDPRDHEIREIRQEKYALEDELALTKIQVLRTLDTFRLQRALYRDAEAVPYINEKYDTLLEQRAHNPENAKFHKHCSRKVRKQPELAPFIAKETLPDVVASGKLKRWNNGQLKVEDDIEWRQRWEREEETDRLRLQTKLRKATEVPYFMRSHTNPRCTQSVCICDLSDSD